MGVHVRLRLSTFGMSVATSGYCQRPSRRFKFIKKRQKLHEKLALQGLYNEPRTYTLRVNPICTLNTFSVISFLSRYCEHGAFEW